jgi:16S rRNA processing protein RimM
MTALGFVMTKNILLGIIIGAQGLKGEVKVKTFTGAAQDLGAYGPLHAGDGRVFTVAAARALNDGVAGVRFKEIGERNAAEALKGVELFVERAALPAPPQGEFYHADLIGLRAEDEEGRIIGVVVAIHNFGAGDVIEISRPDGGHVLLPFTRQIVPRVETARIVVAVPEEVDAREGEGE